MNITTFADWLRTTRESQGYSKNALANASGVDRSHIFKMEKGQIPEPSEETRQKLHATFGTSDDDLEKLGLMERRQYPRADGPVTHYEYVKRPLIPPMQQPVPTNGSGVDDAFLAELAEYLPSLGEPQRRHLIETARMMTNAAVTRAQTPAPSSPVDERPAEAASDRPKTP